MDFIKYKTKEEFLENNLEILLKEEAKKEIMIGILLEHKNDSIQNWVIGRIENKAAMLTGNVDIFDVIFGDIYICAHCGREGMDSYLTCPDCGNDLLDGLIAYDNDTVISKNTILKPIPQRMTVPFVSLSLK